MNTARAETPSLRVLVASRPGLRVLAPSAALRGRDIGPSTVFASRRRDLAGKSVLIGVQSQFIVARALIELDGLAARLVICPPDFSPRRLASVISQAEVDAIVTDVADKDFGAKRETYHCADPVPIDEEDCFTRRASQWVLPRSGTTGAPKLVAHRLEGLLGAIRPMSDPTPGLGHILRHPPLRRSTDFPARLRHGLSNPFVRRGRIAR
jgi:acyl-coenzyme A synthetase/AMP-(fatty) acid ligase